ncbi:hypothetical protein MKFW12EY_12870 [Methylomonas koyamae]|nr:hypothetical protein MKFW12EY_12870 [Methylomonas koyamae]
MFAADKRHLGAALAQGVSQSQTTHDMAAAHLHRGVGANRNFQTHLTLNSGSNAWQRSIFGNERSLTAATSNGITAS